MVVAAPQASTISRCRSPRSSAAPRKSRARPGCCAATACGWSAGGVGKTRLAMRAAASVVESFRDDVWLVIPAIAKVLDVHESGDEPLAVRLEAHLAERTLLLVLDNFEQVASAAPAIAKLLVACPGLKVLATSRVRLRVTGSACSPCRPHSERTHRPLALLVRPGAINRLLSSIVGMRGAAMTRTEGPGTREEIRKVAAARGPSCVGMTERVGAAHSPSPAHGGRLGWGNLSAAKPSVILSASEGPLAAATFRRFRTAMRISPRPAASGRAARSPSSHS